MLRITLYKNSILNETYANVFSLGKKSNKTILEHYLDTLAKKQYEIEYVYQENSGTLVFDYDIDTMSNIYDFNYMKVETVEDGEVKILRYCFIQNIQLKNDLVYLNYEEDMWHSYIGKIAGINESYLDSSRLIDYENGFNLKVRSLPFPYQGNKKLLYSSLIGNFSSNAKFIAILEIQLYNTNQQGEVTSRLTNYYATEFQGVTDLGDEYELGTRLRNGLSFNDIMSRLNELENDKSSKRFRLNYSSSYELRYEIGDIYIVPIEFNLKNCMPPGPPDGNTARFISFDVIENHPQEGVTTYGGEIFYYLDQEGRVSASSNPFLSMVTLKSIEISNNFKLISIGTFSSNIKTLSNGNPFNIDLMMAASSCNIAIYLNINNSLIDITSDFKYELPVAALNSEQLSQLKMSRELSDKNIKEDIRIVNAELVEKEFKNAENGVKGGLKLAEGIALSATGFGAIIGVSKIIKGSAELGSATSKAATDAVIANAKKNKLKNELEVINAPLYASNNSCFGNNEKFVNSRYGIIGFYTNSQNDDFVKKAINNLGYTAYEFLNDISKLRINDANYFISKSINYNFISFKTVSCYGSFVRNTAKILNGILESGVKIWYTETMQEDNYEVG